MCSRHTCTDYSAILKGFDEVPEDQFRIIDSWSANLNNAAVVSLQWNLRCDVRRQSDRCSISRTSSGSGVGMCLPYQLQERKKRLTRKCKWEQELSWTVYTVAINVHKSMTSFWNKEIEIAAHILFLACEITVYFEFYVFFFNDYG